MLRVWCIGYYYMNMIIIWWGAHWLKCSEWCWCSDWPWPAFTKGHTQTHTHTHKCPPTLSCSVSRTRSLCLSRSCSFSVSLSQSLNLPFSRRHSMPDTPQHTRTPMHTHTHTHHQYTHTHWIQKGWDSIQQHTTHMLIRKNIYQRSFCKSVSYQKVKWCLERRCLKRNLSNFSRSIALLLSRLPPARCLSFSLSPSLFLTLLHSLSPTNTHTYTHNTPAHILRAPTKWSRKDHWSWLTISKSQLATCTEFPPNNDHTAQQTFENCFRMPSAPQCYGVNILTKFDTQKDYGAAVWELLVLTEVFY